jgi:ribosomal protein L11 methylase PrmA
LKRDEIVVHKEVSIDPPEPEFAYKVILPQQLKFISYPYEWGFSQLKDAALFTLDLQFRALKEGFTLKDSSAYNLQFKIEDCKPVLIDSLSFERYREGEPWIAYRQYCQHFLAPLALMSKKDVRLNQLLKIFIDGIPLDLASSLLPAKTKINLGIMSHIHLHAVAQARYADKNTTSTGSISKNNLLALIENLVKVTESLNWSNLDTDWGKYYSDTNYSETARQSKIKIVRKFLKMAAPTLMYDLGANRGDFSRLASEMGVLTIAFDIDPGAVDQNYLQIKANKENNILPLIQDLENPSPGIGWENIERDSFFDRGKPDLVMVLALIHHLGIANNIPLNRLSQFFLRLSPWLLIEFVPKEDSQVKRLLRNRKDIFNNYHKGGFEEAFVTHFQIIASEQIDDSNRILYLMKRK